MPPRAHGTIHSGIGFSLPRTVPTDVDLKRAAAVLNAGEKVAMLVGAGAAGAAKEVLEVAELLGAGVAKALLGKAVLPDDLPFVTGAMRSAGDQAQLGHDVGMRHTFDDRISTGECPASVTQWKLT